MKCRIMHISSGSSLFANVPGFGVSSIQRVKPVHEILILSVLSDSQGSDKRPIGPDKDILFA